MNPCESAVQGNLNVVGASGSSAIDATAIACTVRVYGYRNAAMVPVIQIELTKFSKVNSGRA